MSGETEIKAPSQEAAAALEAIRGFLASTAPQAFGGKVDESTQLLANGALDSLGILQLTMFLGDELKIEVTDEDFVPENLETVGSLVQFVLRKQNVAP
jgi:acyl carrier protein